MYKNKIALTKLGNEVSSLSCIESRVVLQCILAFMDHLGKLYSMELNKGHERAWNQMGK